ncbi:hypothetical protein SAMD00019534_082580 [Acytostelium subglobosum LB1]|uniref:hypothetical protein n=1 Tax=Acytostelium subglobosum LB1 TaxID=1410327 RepID=UPI000644DF72|nr:hypothetical protein SAMD00019534_082580 [Acytostelium subglobosum LB1]GAM25083.1 hypothetical protein SAMD00019534_082580 [Acytostelium subglobosum LB1]|eukprot:XP_012752172.1 hypothetical protein SAMD00019534_082580 [Acytostelium subglobosum LB1]
MSTTSTNSYSLDNLDFKTNQSFLSTASNAPSQYWNDLSQSGEGMMSKISGKISGAVGGTKKEEPTFYEEVQQQTSFSYMQRIIIFVITLGLGIAFIAMSTFFIFAPKTFAKLYTLGSLCVILGLVILVGVKKQLENITSSKERLYSSLIYLCSIFGTLYCALSLQSTILTMMMVIFQFVAVIWYSLSYIPFGQALIQKVTGGLLSYFVSS